MSRKLIPQKILDALESCGKPWEIERGSKHFKLKVGGKLAGILPLNGKTEASPRAEKNCIAQINRAANGEKSC